METKGQVGHEVPSKMARLKQWCDDINAAQSDIAYDYVFVDDEGFQKYRPKRFADVLYGFTEYKGADE